MTIATKKHAKQLVIRSRKAILPPRITQAPYVQRYSPPQALQPLGPKPDSRTLSLQELEIHQLADPKLSAHSMQLKIGDWEKFE